MSDKPKIAPYVHRCIVPSGSLAGNKAAREVTATEAEYAIECDVCGERLATPEQLALHVYEELTNGL
jgi:hypothetical protein